MILGWDYIGLDVGLDQSNNILCAKTRSPDISLVTLQLILHRLVLYDKFVISINNVYRSSITCDQLCTNRVYFQMSKLFDEKRIGHDCQ